MYLSISINAYYTSWLSKTVRVGSCCSPSNKKFILCFLLLYSYEHYVPLPNLSFGASGAIKKISKKDLFDILFLLRDYFSRNVGTIPGSHF